MEIGDQQAVNGTINNIQGSASQQVDARGGFQQSIEGPVTQIFVRVPLTIDEILRHCDTEVMAFIQEFDDTLHNRLIEAKSVVSEIFTNLDERERALFLERYRYPYGVEHADHAGVAELWKLLILCHVAYTGWEIDNAFITHNLLLPPNQWRRIIHSCWSQQSMPKIIIHLAKHQKKHIGRSIFPHRLVILNSDQFKYNLCQHCGKEAFPFDRILQDYGRSEDRLIFKGVGYDNSFKDLEKIEVYDAGCMMREAIDATDHDDLTIKVREVL
jgi:hypothetical protein